MADKWENIPCYCTVTDINSASCSQRYENYLQRYFLVDVTAAPTFLEATTHIL
jgi:hypothetical protein